MYLGNGKFLANMAEVAKKAEPNSEFATGLNMPSSMCIPIDHLGNGHARRGKHRAADRTEQFCDRRRKTASVGITTDSGSYIYNIDVANAAATQGLEVQGGTITAIDKIESTVEVDN